VPQAIRDAADLVIDGGELPGTPSTVIDLRAIEASGDWSILREGAVPAATVAAHIKGQTP
jgi:L-threonylcarbamoyladenylate synthase